MNPRRLLSRLLHGDLANVAMRDLETLLEHLGFVQRRTSGSHRIFGHPVMQIQINIQEVAGEAKPYQVRQLWRLVQRYNLRLKDDQ